jgi:uncharacterized protein (DUF1919 family)
MRRKVKQSLCRALVGSSDFTVVSNNCWGAHLYEKLGVPYKTPFVGLFVPPEDYLRLLDDFDALIGGALVFADKSAFPRYNTMRAERGLTYPIAVLGGKVELHFMHYKTVEEADSKWHRRRLRMVKDPERYFFKFDDRDASREDIERFVSLPFMNKVCFTAKPMGVPTILAPEEPGLGEVIDGARLGRKSKQFFNALRWVSTRPAYVPLPSWL